MYYYKSLIQRGAQTEGSYLLFAANLNASDLQEIELIDVARAGIEFNPTSVFTDIANQAQRWVESHPKNDQTSQEFGLNQLF